VVVKGFAADRDLKRGDTVEPGGGLWLIDTFSISQER
jgi:hypothetical protein